MGMGCGMDAFGFIAEYESEFSEPIREKCAGEPVNVSEFYAGPTRGLNRVRFHLGIGRGKTDPLQIPSWLCAST